MLARAIAIVSQAFVDKKDKGGQPYVLHCLRVMNGVDTDEEKQAGILHDLIEDTNWTLNDLLLSGFSEKVVKAVEVLTHLDDVSYDDYIYSVASNPIARKVKLADLKDNSDINRLKGLREKDFERMKKYHRAYKYLQF